VEGLEGVGGRFVTMFVVTFCQSVTTKCVCSMGEGARAGWHECLCIHLGSFCSNTLARNLMALCRDFASAASALHPNIYTLTPNPYT